MVALLVWVFMASCSSNDGGTTSVPPAASGATSASSAASSIESNAPSTTQAVDATATDEIEPTADSVKATVPIDATTTTSPIETTTTAMLRDPVKVTGPIMAGAGQFGATLVDLEAAAYVEEEYFIEGDAKSYEANGELGADGKWSVRPGGSAPFRTRIIVRRPMASAFSGTVLVEWLNVSAGADVDPGWGYASQEIIRSRHAWVGVDRSVRPGRARC